MEIQSRTLCGQLFVEIGKYGLFKTAIASLAMPFYHNSFTLVVFYSRS